MKMFIRKTHPLLLATALFLQADAALAAESIWIEGEDAQSSTFNNHSWYCCADVRTELLSPGSPDQPDTPGDWLSHFSNDGGTAAATYEFTVTEGGS